MITSYFEIDDAGNRLLIDDAGNYLLISSESSGRSDMVVGQEFTLGVDYATIQAFIDDRATASTLWVVGDHAETVGAITDAGYGLQVAGHTIIADDPTAKHEITITNNNAAYNNAIVAGFNLITTAKLVDIKVSLSTTTASGTAYAYGVRSVGTSSVIGCVVNDILAANLAGGVGVIGISTSTLNLLAIDATGTWTAPINIGFSDYNGCTWLNCVCTHSGVNYGWYNLSGNMTRTNCIAQDGSTGDVFNTGTPTNTTCADGQSISFRADGYIPTEYTGLGTNVGLTYDIYNIAWGALQIGAYYWTEGGDMIFNLTPSIRGDLVETVNTETLTVGRAGTMYYQDADGAFQTALTNVAAFNDGMLSNGAYTQECAAPERPDLWNVSGVTVAATGITVNGLTEYATNGASELYHRALLWESGVSGAPAALQVGALRYNAGTSGAVYVRFYDAVAGSTLYYGTIGSAIIASQGTAGTLTIISDTLELDAYGVSTGYRKIVFTMAWSNVGNTLNIGIGPYSTTGKTILIYSADVFDAAYELPHTPTAVSVVTQAADGTGNGLRATIASFPGLAAALADDITVIMGIKPQFPSTDLSATDQPLLSSANNLLAVDSSLYISADGTNTTTVAHGGFSKDDELSLVMKANDTTDKMRTGYVDAGGVTWGTEGNYDGTFNPTSYLEFFENNEQRITLQYLAIFDTVLTDDEIATYVASISQGSTVQFLYPPNFAYSYSDTRTGNKRMTVNIQGTVSYGYETDVVKVDISELQNTIGGTPTKLIVEKIQYEAHGLTAILKWGNEEFFRASGSTGSTSGEIDFTGKDYECAGLTPSAVDGDITLSTEDTATGDTYDITLTIRLK